MSDQAIPPELIPYLLGEKTDYSSVQGSIITVNVIFITLICTTTGLRFWVRFGMLGAAGTDDILMIAALIFALLLSTACLVGHSFGLGKHIWNLSPALTELPAAAAQVTKALYGCYLAYATAIAFIKFSIMATYFRIFVPKGMLRRAVLAIGVIVFCFWISSIFAVIFTCVPVQAAWDWTIPNAKCFPVVNFFYVAAGFNMATDLLLCFLPFPTLWALKMPTAQRVVLCILFSGGTFACIASILRLSQLHNLGGLDVTYESVGSLNWSVVEVGTAIICASLSSLRPLAARILPKIFQHLSHSSERTPKLSSSQATPKVGSSKHARITSNPINVPMSKFSTSNSSEKIDSGQVRIVVERTFDVTELKELPAVPSPSPMSSVPAPKKWRSRGEMGMFTDTARLFDKSSEEDLIKSTSLGRGPKA